MRRRLTASSCAALLVLLASSTSYAQQSLNFHIGGFVPRGEDARGRNDVLVNNLDFLSFNISDFHAPSIGAEYLVGIGEWLDAGLGIGFSRRTVPVVYTEFVNATGAEIEQDLKLRMVPFTATFRFLPLGHGSAIQPYVGAGVGIVAWRYSESGEFIDFSDGSIFRDSFVGSGSAVGPVVFGGAQFPVGNWGIGGEIRYQNAKGDLPTNLGFSGTKIDLGGWIYAATFRVGF